MSYEAMDAGIEPGGLRDVNEIKILICYLLKNSSRPLSFDNLNEILQQDGLVNYFEFGQSLHELLLSGHVDLSSESGQELYRITRLGAGTADMFERRLPRSVREKAERASVRLLARLKIESENKVLITRDESGWRVECRVLDGADELLNIRLLVPSPGQAEAVRRQFLEDPAAVYRGAIALLTGDPETVSAPGQPPKTDDPPAEK